MKTIAVLVLALTTLIPSVVLAQNKALVVVTNDAGLPEATEKIVSRLTINALRAENIEVVERPELDRSVLLDDGVKTLARETGANQVYALRLSSLGEKLIVELQALTPELAVTNSRSLTSRGIEELDLVIPRLAKALIANRSLEETAEIDTVSKQEGRQWEKRPGEFFWGFGISVGGAIADHASTTYGLDLRFAYEMEHLRLNVNLGGMWPGESGDDGTARMTVGVSYLPFKTSASPYFGVDFGYLYVNAGDGDGSGVGIIPHVGYEFFRLHSVRLLVEAGCVVPFFKTRGQSWGTGDLPDEVNAFSPVFFGQVAVIR